MNSGNWGPCSGEPLLLGQDVDPGFVMDGTAISSDGKWFLFINCISVWQKSCFPQAVQNVPRAQNAATEAGFGWVYANICTLGLKRIQSICGNLSVGMEVIMKKSLWASWV